MPRRGQTHHEVACGFPQKTITLTHLSMLLIPSGKRVLHDLIFYDEKVEGFPW